VRVTWEFSDTDAPANQIVIDYPFYTTPDLIKPRIRNLVPSNRETDVPIAGPLQFELVDFEQDVDITTLKLYVNNILVTDGIDGVVEITRLVAENGYSVKYTPNEPWLYGDLIPVAVFVQDTSIHDNELFFAYSFTTVESLPPRMINLAPDACELNVSTRSDVKMTIIDGGHGLDKDSIKLSVEETDVIISLEPVVHRDN
jgi:hypothetical protein